MLHVVASVGRAAGGLSLQVLGLVGEMRQRAQPATIWSLDNPGYDAFSADEAAALAGHAGFHVWGPRSIGFSPSMERAAGAASAEAFDVLHQHGIWMATSRVTRAWRAATGRPTVISTAGTLAPVALRRSAWKKALAARLYETDNLRSATCLVATSAAEASSIRAFGLPNPIAIIPLGVSNQWLESRGEASRFRAQFSLRHNQRLLLFLGRLHPIKGLPLLLEAMAAARPALAGWQLIIGGVDEVGTASVLQHLSRRLGLQDLVRFAGPLFGQAKRDAFAAAELFVLPSYSENFAIVVAEALGAGVPTLTTCGTPWQDVQTYQCGWWTEPTIEAIHAALLDAVQRSPSELATMGQRGVDLVRKRYTWPIVAEKSMVLYRWLLGQAGQPDFVLLT